MNIRVAILCNDRLCLPAVSWLLGSGITAAVAMPAGMHETQMMVQQQCRQFNIPFRFFEKEGLEESLGAWLLQYQPDVVLVKTFPWRIPSSLLTIPKHGFINFHYAPLPAFRGPNPLFWMIRRQEKTGGVTVHVMDKLFDHGPVLLQQSIPMSPDLTYGWFCTQLAYSGLQLTWNLLQGLQAGTLHPIPQDKSHVAWYPRPTASDVQIHWSSMPAAEIRALALACNPWNKGAATSWNNWMFGVTDASVVENMTNPNEQPKTPGTVLASDEQNGLLVSCMHGQVLRINIVYCEEGFFPGYRLNAFGIRPGCILGSHHSLQNSLSQPPPVKQHSS